MKLLIALAFIICVVSADYRKTFGVTYPKNSDLPISPKEAMKKGWHFVDTDIHKCLTRYISKKKDIVNIVYYDSRSALAGIEVGVYDKPTEPMLSRYYTEKKFEGKTYWALIAFFVQPDNMCNHRTAGKYGDRIWWVSHIPEDKGYFKMPLTEAEVKQNPRWKLGKCIIGMGIHYWYDISADMDCNDFNPFFLMYNSGKLTTFATGFVGSKQITTPDSRFEHAPKWVVKANFLEETFPKCLMKDEIKVNTMHMFFTSVFSNRCQRGEALKKLPKKDFLKCVQNCLKKKLGSKKWEALFKKCQTNVKCYLKEAGFAGVQCGIQCK
eukprot:gene2367-2834_t